jgi:peptidoglycan/xylan/chitin deacetylase (PgdA/CDA1 family)
VTILCYHAIDQRWQSPLAVRPHDFGRQIRWLIRYRRMFPLDAAVDRLDARGRLPRGAVALTFDDGFASVHDHAWPLLRSAGAPCAIFVVTETFATPPQIVNWVDDPPSWPLSTMTADQVLEMRDGGVVVGSHTRTHPRLPDLSDAECRREMVESRERLEDLVGGPVLHLAYPRGLNDARVRRLAEASGYRWAFTLPESREPFDRYGIPRIGVYRRNRSWEFAVKTSRVYRDVRLGKSGPRLRGLVRSLRRGPGSRPEG